MPDFVIDKLGLSGTGQFLKNKNVLTALIELRALANNRI